MEFRNAFRSWCQGPVWATTAAALLIAGCTATSSNLANLWKSPDAPRPMQSVLVVSMAREPAIRRVWEDRFVYEFNKRGTSATASYRLFPDQPPDTSALIDAVATAKSDGILTIHRLSNETSEHYVPGYRTITPYQRFNPWTGYYHTHYVEAYTPGFQETDTIVRYEVDLWSPETNVGLIWSGVTETLNPSSSAAVNREVSKLIVPELDRSGVVSEPNRHH